MSNLIEGSHYTQNSAGQYVFDTGLIPVGSQVTINYSVSYAGFWQSALGQLGLNLAGGYIGQPVWSWLQSYSPAQALAYSGMAYVYADAYPLTNQAEVENHSFEVVTGHAVSASVPDCWPDRVLKDMLVFDTSSVGWREGRLAPMTQLINYTRARQIWLSVAMTQQRPAREWLEGLAMICNAEWTWQGGLLDLVPRGDEAITSSHGTYTPVTTPVFDLVHGEGGDILEPVEVTPRVNEDAYNIIKIEWTNRANGYAIEVMTASDAAHIEQFGERPKDVMQMHAIHDPAVAQSVAQQLLQREMTVWNTYKFRVPFSRALMGLMDLATLTDADSDLDRTPVRILKREEDGQLKYSFEAEDAPIGSASAPIYGQQGGAGFAHDYNADPGDVAAPVIFEAPTERTSSGLEVYAAVSGLAGAPGALWGGCSVHVSLDGLNYRNTGRLYGGARYGQLTAAMATSGNAAITLAGRGGQLLSGSAQDAAALSTLCWVAGSQGGEYFSYQTATLTGANAYTLSALTRGAYQNPVAAHSSGAAFVRIDDALATSGPLTDEMIGQAIYFKFTSFNVYGGGEQALGDVVEYSYTVTGDQLKLPPPTPDDFAITGNRLNWTAFTRAQVPDIAGYQIRFNYGNNIQWLTATPLHEGLITDTPYEMRSRPSGTVTLLLCAVDTTGNESEQAAVIITDLGDAPIANVIEVIDFDAQGYPGLITGGSVSGGDVLASVTNAFWPANSASAFWPADPSTPFWPLANYAALQYTTPIFTIASALIGSIATLATTGAGSGLVIEYRRVGAQPFWPAAGGLPFWPADPADPFWPAPGVWLPWPGQLALQNGAYQLRVSYASGFVQSRINTLALTIDAPDLIETINDLPIAIGGTTIVPTENFTAIQNIAFSLQAGVSGAVGVRIDKTNPLAPIATAVNGAGAAVAGASIDLTLKGY